VSSANENDTSEHEDADSHANITSPKTPSSSQNNHPNRRNTSRASRFHRVEKALDKGVLAMPLSLCFLAIGCETLRQHVNVSDLRRYELSSSPMFSNIKY